MVIENILSLKKVSLIHLTQSMTHPSIHEEKTLDENKSKYFETEGILNLSLRNNKHENLSDTLSNEPDDSI